MKNKNIKAAFNAVIVKPKEHDEQMYGNLVVPDLGKEKNLTGTIVSVGPGHYSVTGEFIPTQLKEGQEVILPQMGVTKVDFQGDEYWACPENTVLGVIE
jgi:chaperonin GroES